MATLIYDVGDLQDIALDLAGDYEIANDIDASGFGFVPLGTFTGTLDFKGYVVTNLTITLNAAGIQRGALIVTNDGTVKNGGLEDCAISVTSTNNNAYVGSIAQRNNGTIQNCHVTGSLTAIANTAIGWACAGGIASYNTGTISKSNSTATITCTSTKHAEAGGLVESNGGNIEISFASGNVTVTGTGTVNAAGFVAWNGYYAVSLITDCYARGNASANGGTAKAAGFVQKNDTDGSIEDSYSTGVPTGASGTGGFCETNNDTITDCFWDTETSGTAVSDGGMGKTTAEMKTKSTFTDADWDFIVIWGILSTINDGYPFFWAMEEIPDSPRRTDPIEDKITLESIRNVEMVAMGRFRVDKEGNAVYKSRYARNA